MNKSKWLVLAVALAMMAGTGDYLTKFRQRMHLGPPGVRVGPVELYDEQGHLAATNGVLLPERVLEARGADLPVTRVELDSLPRDTTFGRKKYRGEDNFQVTASVVLMGSDRTSIHQPQFCLVGQNWTIEKTEAVFLPMDRPYPYKLPALKVTVSRRFSDAARRPMIVRGLYVYWFVTADKITPGQGARFWSIARTMVWKGELERWDYISYFATCLPGQEESTFGKMERFIRASVPDFQTVAGQPSGPQGPVVAR
jgi:hypothetical protein